MCPMGLDEYESSRLIAELKRRRHAQLDGRCDYCGRPKTERPCHLGERHSSDDLELPSVIDADHLGRQRSFSHKTFGPGQRLQGALDHLRKELVEVQENPQDVEEWADVIILACDGAMRAGIEPQELIDTVIAKQGKNEEREWPDWRTQAPDKAIEHLKGAGRMGGET